MKFIATCKMGLESVVGFELESMGITVLAKEDARVLFTGTYADMARACLHLRTAERVLFVIGEFVAKSFTELFDNTFALKLKSYFVRDSQIHVNGKSAKSTLFSVSDCQSIVKKAIVENLKVAFGARTLPESGREIILEVGILKDNVTIALDPCGAGLSRRGYRIHNYDAPIAETLGAAIVILSRYRADMPFIDPMCGSGTMPIEAAMIATNRAPGLNRSFAGENWHFMPKGLFANLKNEAFDLITDTKVNILGSDINPRAIAIAKEHAKNAGIMVNWAVKPLGEISTASQRGILVCNPPYGERMLSKHEIERLYREMRKTFDGLPDEWSKNIITSAIDFERVYGLHADKRRNLSNGGKKCTLYSYFAKRPQ